MTTTPALEPGTPPGNGISTAIHRDAACAHQPVHTHKARQPLRTPAPRTGRATQRCTHKTAQRFVLIDRQRVTRTAALISFSSNDERPLRWDHRCTTATPPHNSPHDHEHEHEHDHDHDHDHVRRFNTRASPRPQVPTATDSSTTFTTATAAATQGHTPQRPTNICKRRRRANTPAATKQSNGRLHKCTTAPAPDQAGTRKAPPTHPRLHPQPTRATAVRTATHSTRAPLCKPRLSRHGASRRGHRPSHPHGHAARRHHRGGRYRRRAPGCGCGRA